MASISFQPRSLSVVQVGQYLAGLTAVCILTVVVYRLHFHPISKYPGPKLWAATALPSAYYAIVGAKASKMSELHNQYGPIVRVGPYELSYVSEVAERDIYSSHRASGGKQLGKYKFTPPSRIGGIFNNPNDADHSRLRKILGVAFSDKAVREREPFLQDYTTLFIKRLKEQPVGKPIDMTWWLGCIGFDTVAHLTFGDSFHALQTTTLPEIASQNHDLLVTSARRAALGPFFLGRQLYKCFGEPPSFPIRRKIFAGLFEGHEARRNAGKKGENEVEDLVSIMSKKIGSQKGLSQGEMAVVSNDLNIAGSDTSASALSAMIYHLLQNPSKLQILTKEIRSSFKTEEEIKGPAINNLKYLNAVINESMRLSHPAPETTRRITNPGGNTICGDHIPGDIRVGVYRYAAGHYAPAWKDVEFFVPERWLGDKEYEGDNLGLVNPFAIGPRNCIGQIFAMVYMRLVLGRLFWNFDLELCVESKNWLDMKMYSLIIDKAPLFVKLKSVR
ncbi:cytochrome P450 [Hyaloscypha bicolor E]|uniref:Cytochrome P450 n=1 Tax=Hyaloscypha bicolor E TaxID=1095630 RepID=A0A2J6SFL0_9HELO|nr:cytochrome P450 [Hyaloscypha bicolor E]PMD49540.1 cytochrome P450 [Hyaloscypha bicolor E]